MARAEQRIGMGRTTEAAADLRTAVVLVHKVGDPELFVRPAAALWPVDGDDAIAAEGRGG